MANGLEKIKNYLTQVKREVILEDGVSYKLLGVRWYGEGMFLREEKLGKNISAKKLYEVKEGDFVYNRLFAWKSSFAIVGKEFDGCLVSNEFPVFTYDPEQTNPHYLLRYVLQPDFIYQVNKLSGGMSSVSRKRLKENDFLDVEIPKLSLPDQRKIVDYFRSFENEWSVLKAELSHQQTLLKKLRQQILQEAIEGKLTADWRAQNPNVEPASELLKRIAAEKSELFKAKKIKAQKPLPPISDEEKPFELPLGWEWYRLGELFNFIDYRGKTPRKLTSGVRLITARNVKQGQLSLEPEDFISKEEYGERMTRGFPLAGDLLFTTEAPLGNVCLLSIKNEAVSTGQRLITMQNYLKEFSNKVFMFFILSPFYQDFLVENATGVTAKGIKASRLKELLIPVPSYCEQKAIVANIEKLLAICDQLETQITQNQTHAEQLMQAVLKEAFSKGSTSLPVTSETREAIHA